MARWIAFQAWALNPKRFYDAGCPRFSALRNRRPRELLAGIWVVVSRVISTATILRTLLLTLLITAHELPLLGSRHFPLAGVTGSYLAIGPEEF